MVEEVNVSPGFSKVQMQDGLKRTKTLLEETRMRDSRGRGGSGESRETFSDHNASQSHKKESG